MVVSLRSWDATYKTTRYAIPLFFVCVQTNVGYKVVAEFMCQSKEQVAISEAISILKKWNPSWNPRFFMTCRNLGPGRAIFWNRLFVWVSQNPGNAKVGTSRKEWPIFHWTGCIPFAHAEDDLRTFEVWFWQSSFCFSSFSPVQRIKQMWGIMQRRGLVHFAGRRPLRLSIPTTAWRHKIDYLSMITCRDR